MTYPICPAQTQIQPKPSHNAAERVSRLRKDVTLKKRFFFFFIIFSNTCKLMYHRLNFHKETEGEPIKTGQTRQSVTNRSVHKPLTSFDRNQLV